MSVDFLSVLKNQENPHEEESHVDLVPIESRSCSLVSSTSSPTSISDGADSLYIPTPDRKLSDINTVMTVVNDIMLIQYLQHSCITTRYMGMVGRLFQNYTSLMYFVVPGVYGK